MIIISYPAEDKALDQITEKLQELSLAFQTEASSGLADIQLEDGLRTVVGKVDILEYLDQLQGELKQWYYCSC